MDFNRQTDVSDQIHRAPVDSEHYSYRDGRDHRSLVLCDHATNRIPAELGNLGLPPEERNRHIGYDIGALPLAQAIAQRLSAPIFWPAWSRLVADVNRAPKSLDVVPPISDGTMVPGNQALDESAQADRIARYHTPYHDAISRHLDHTKASGQRPIMLAIHTMTDCLREEGVPRTMQASVLWLDDDVIGDQLARPLIDWLCLEGLSVGDNSPYDCNELKSMCYTLDHHARRRGLPYLLIEVRQDLLDGPEAIERWAELLVRGLRAVCRSA